MPTLLVPVDFSANSRHALRFAQAMAKDMGARIHLLHVWHPSLFPTEAPGTLPVTYTENAGRAQLTAFAKEHGISESDTTLAVGFAAERIIEASKQPEIDYVVLGSEEHEPDLADRLIGNIATEVCQDAHCPVLVVPEGVDYGKKGFRRILYASSASALDTGTVTQVVDLAKTFHADVHFVHVQTDDDEEDITESMEVEDSLFKELHEDSETDIRAHLVNIEDESVVEGLTQYARENEIDLMVSVTRHRSWWQELLHRSQTKQLTLHAELPLLVLHLED